MTNPDMQQYIAAEAYIQSWPTRWRWFRVHTIKLDLKSILFRAAFYKHKELIK